jgi:hypothetical protein
LDARDVRDDGGDARMLALAPNLLIRVLEGEMRT